MKAGVRFKESAVIVLAVFLITGCSANMTANVQEKMLTTGDIIAMSKAGVGSGVITRKIMVSRSRFTLNTNDIILLKKEGVSDDVIHAMIDTDQDAEMVDQARSYSLYDYWFNYYNTFYPSNIYSLPDFPNPYFMYWPRISPLYQWSGDEGRYYRNFPVGLPKGIPGTYPPDLKVPRGKDESEGKQKSDNADK